MLGSLPADYKAQEQLAIRKAKTYEADQAKDPYVQFNRGVEAVGQTLGGWIQSYAETADSLTQYRLPREELRAMEIRNNLEPGVLTDRDRHQEILQAFGETSEAIMHPIQGWVKDRLMDTGMGYDQAKAFTSLSELMIATGAGKRLLGAAGRTRLPTGRRSVGAARAPNPRLNTILTRKAVDVAAELSDWMREGKLGPTLGPIFNKLNPKGMPIFRGDISYEGYKALASSLIKSSIVPGGMKLSEFKQTYGAFPHLNRKTGEITLRQPKSADRQGSQARSIMNRQKRQQPPTEEELKPFFEDMGIPLELRKEFIRYAKTGFRRVQNVSSELSRKTGVKFHAGHPFPLNQWGDPLDPNVNKMWTSPTSDSAYPEDAQANMSKGQRAAVNVHAAREAGIPATWEDMVVQWYARQNDIKIPDWLQDWTDAQRQAILNIPENWQQPKVEVMMEKIRAMDADKHWSISDILEVLAEGARDDLRNTTFP